MMATGAPGWWQRTRVAKPARRRAALGVLAIASCAGALLTMFSVAMRTEPPRLAVASAVVVDADGTASVVDALHYRYTWSGADGGSRVGFLHVLSDSGSGVVPRLDEVTADVPVEAVSARQGHDLAVRVASPIAGDPPQRATLSGDHGYRMRSTQTLVSRDGRLTWDVVGRGWNNRVAEVAARLVGPWRWETPRCRITGAVAGSSCTVRSARAGELVVTAHHLSAGERVTVTARRGATVQRPVARPVPIPAIGVAPPLWWWSNPAVMGGLVLLAAMVPGLVLGRVLRWLGRDMVPVGGLDPGTLPEPGGYVSDPGVARIDDTRLAALATPVPVPPDGLEPWQGALIRGEAPNDPSRLAWFFGHLARGHLSVVGERGRDGTDDLVLVRVASVAPSPGDDDDTLDLGFAGRDRVVIGRADRDLAAAWRTLEPLQLAWLLDSGLSDPDRARWVRKWRRTAGFVVFPVFVVAVYAAMFAGLLGQAGGFVVPGIAAVCGLLVTFPLRVWELEVRTPLGSTWWVRVEAFRRFLAESGVVDVIAIADRGELGGFTAWAVALDVTDHWASTVAGSGLPDDTPGLDVAVVATDVARALRAVVNQADAQAEATRRNKERRQQKRGAKSSP